MATKKTKSAVVEKEETVIVQTVEERLESFDSEMALIAAKHLNLVKQYNDALEDKDYDKAAEINPLIIDAETKYAEKAASKVKYECEHSDDPMMYCITKLTYQVLTHKDPVDKETAQIIRVAELKDKEIDITSMQKKIGTLGVNNHWLSVISMLNKSLSLRTCDISAVSDENKVNIQTYYKLVKDDSEYIKKLEKELNNGENPVTDAKLKDLMQEAINCMIGEQYALRDGDFGAVISTYAKKGKGLKLITMNENKLTDMFKYICYGIVYNKPWEVVAKLSK